MAAYQQLDQREEDELHRSRLLNVEERPFKRVSKRLLTPGSLLITPNTLPTPPPDSSDEATDAERQKALEERRQLREDIILDFSAFDNVIARLQFMRNSNVRERERYAADKEHILETAQAVRDSTAQLRVQLQEAQNRLEQRKKFDVLAEKITSNVLLRPRKDQEVNLRKLEEECKELQRESKAYGETWKERREQFGRIVEEGMQLRRLIRDEKEEVERREGMEQEDGEVGETGSGDGQTPKGSTQDVPTSREGTPDRAAGLKPRPAPSGSMSRATSRSRAGSRSRARTRSRSGSRTRRGKGSERDSRELRMTEGAPDVMETVDTPMMDGMDTTQSGMGTPQVTVNEPEEGAVEEGEAEDKMDTT